MSGLPVVYLRAEISRLQAENAQLREECASDEQEINRLVIEVQHWVTKSRDAHRELERWKPKARGER